MGKTDSLSRRPDWEVGVKTLDLTVEYALQLKVYI